MGAVGQLHGTLRELTLPGQAGSAALARQFVIGVVRELGPADLVEPAVLCASELVANAVRYAEGPYRLAVLGGDGEIHIEVHDTSPVAPRAQQPPPEAESGRGLRIVEVQSAAWGVEPDPDRGKAVWCTIRRAGRR